MQIPNRAPDAVRFDGVDERGNVHITETYLFDGPSQTLTIGDGSEEPPQGDAQDVVDLWWNQGRWRP